MILSSEIFFVFCSRELPTFSEVMSNKTLTIWYGMTLWFSGVYCHYSIDNAIFRTHDNYSS